MKIERSHMAREIDAQLTNHDMTQQQLGSAAGLAQGSLSCIMSGRRNRPAVETLQKLCAAKTWPTRPAALDILIAHLRDEIERAGHRHRDIDMRPSNGHQDTRAMLDEISTADHRLSAHLDALIRHLHAATITTAPAKMVAETAEKYSAKKKNQDTTSVSKETYKRNKK